MFVHGLAGAIVGCIISFFMLLMFGVSVWLSFVSVIISFLLVAAYLCLVELYIKCVKE